MKKQTIADLDVTGKRVFIRVDFNVPMASDGTIGSDARIRKSLPTIRHVVERGGRVILASHLGRPKNGVGPSLKPVAARLTELLGQPVSLAPDCMGPEVEAMVAALPPGGVILLENVRFRPGEEKNDPVMAEGFARLADCVVNDAFGTAHRAHASNVGVAQKVTPAVAGLLMAEELDFFHRAMIAPQRPVVALLGGSKVSTKMQLIESLLAKMDAILIGGAMAFTFVAARGGQVGASLVEPEMLEVARQAEARAKEAHVELLLPVDAVVSTRSDGSGETKVVPVDQIPEGWMGLDVGPETVRRFAERLAGAATVVWNGPVGVFEVSAFAEGTLALARHIANSSALSVTGGGDTEAAIAKAGVAEQISHISTGGGAFLELLEGRELPGVAVLADVRG
ncbi:MAG: phosphoglycerate kinase [Magnetococcales bacterium]|nr:phosphoglycerate kinase [Magnetococcales bacterium]